jgi:nitroimidazol reductase NimA-like FMN-containing flavoprotein (pyridoxamine 5'-phosphate oxidase superfamily)
VVTVQTKTLPGDFVPTARTRVKRLHQRACYDRETVYGILDAGVMCHVGYVIDGQPYVTPTAYWRLDDRVYWHGSSASRMLRHQAKGVPVCFTVALMDGLVLARSAFHSSMNYRTVMALGVAEKVVEKAAKLAALEAFVERLTPGRWAESRPVTDQELKATTVLTLKLDEGLQPPGLGRRSAAGHHRERAPGRWAPDAGDRNARLSERSFDRLVWWN